MTVLYRKRIDGEPLLGVIPYGLGVVVPSIVFVAAAYARVTGEA